jgi:hypothetical protein
MLLSLTAIVSVSMTLNGWAAEDKFCAYYTRHFFSDKHTDKFSNVVFRLDGLGGEFFSAGNHQ